jgi:ubiquinone/menaquinone biosynthesis C-methylase UbiE
MTTRAATASYDLERLGRDFDAEVERLHAQAAVSWDVERRRMAALGVADGQAIVEPGCGPGAFTERLASWLPRSQIVAFDSDPRMVAAARRASRRGAWGSRVQVVEGSAHATGLPAGTFDIAISRYVFQHLRDPVAAAAEIRRVLRPGGRHIVIDVDAGLWGVSDPLVHEFADWHRRRAVAQRERGGDRLCGRRLGRILRAAGYTRVSLDVFAYDSDELGISAFAGHLAPEQLAPLLEEGRLTLEEYSRAQALYRGFLAARPFVLAVGFIATGVSVR